MANKESKTRKIGKSALKLLSYVCVDGAAAGITASVVPLTMINPIVGGIVVAGSAIVSMAVCDRVVDVFIDDKVDECAEKYHENVDPIVESMKLIKRGMEIFTSSGEQAAKDFLKANGFDEKQINEIIESYKKKK